MKQLSRLGFLFGVVLAISSCTEGKMKEFAEQFAMAVNNNDAAAVSQMYPDAKEAEGLTVVFVKDSLSVEELADTFVVNFGGGSSISILKNEEGNLRIVDSHKVFSYSSERMNFALKTGWVEENMSDLKIAEQFKDTVFINYLVHKNVEQIKSDLTVKSVDSRFSNDQFYDSHYGMNVPTEYITATVINNSDYDISGSDYKVEVVYFEPHNKTFPGKDIKKGATETFTIKVCPQEMRASAKVIFVASDADLLARYFTPRGDEYKNYLASPISKK